MFISFVAFRFVGSPNERALDIQNELLRDNYHNLENKVEDMEQQMSELEKRDNNVIALFSKPILSPTVRGQRTWKNRSK
ncbi:MAG: hypothetical protein WDO16_11545 [Bacteroidota bacterium]